MTGLLNPIPSPFRCVLANLLRFLPRPWGSFIGLHLLFFPNKLLGGIQSSSGEGPQANTGAPLPWHLSQLATLHYSKLKGD